MDLVPRPTPAEEAALVQVIDVALSVVLLADLVLFGVMVAGWIRGRSLLARRWSAAHVLVALQVWLLLTVLVLSFSAGFLGVEVEALQEGIWPPALTVLSLLAANVIQTGVVLFIVLKLYDQWSAAVGLSLRGWGPRLVIGLVAALVLIPVSTGLESLSALALHHTPPSPSTEFLTHLQQAVEKGYLQMVAGLDAVGGLGLTLFVVGIAAPFAEELFFRGFAYRCFRARWGVPAGLFASALLFSAVHLHPLGLLPILAVGWVLAYLYQRTGTLVAPFALHAANNTLWVLLSYFAPQN